MELAEFVLRHNAGWSREAIDQADAQPDTQLVSVRRPVPVLLEYRTAWLDANGTIQFRDDVYGLDKQFRRGYGERTAQITEAAKALF
jgi:murein L,D-transpeptidase YcbB/YkuD